MNKQFNTLGFILLAIIILSFIVGFSFGALLFMNITKTEYIYTEIYKPVALIEKTEHEESDEVWETFTATAYCSCEKCCGQWAKNRPNGVVYTANGQVAEAGTTIAADWNVLPPGTKVEIKGLGIREVQDSGSAIKGNKIDLYFNSHEEAWNYGKQEVLIKKLKGNKNYEK